MFHFSCSLLLVFSTFYIPGKRCLLLYEVKWKSDTTGTLFAKEKLTETNQNFKELLNVVLLFRPSGFDPGEKLWLTSRSQVWMDKL